MEGSANNGSLSRSQSMGAKEAPRRNPASPPSSLASDLRQFSMALQESPHPELADVSSTTLASCSNLSSVHQGRDGPASRRTGTAGGASRELFAINQLRGQCESQRRRLAQLERRMEVQLEDRLQGGDIREKWAETQGTVTGLLEDVQFLRQRLDLLDQRRNEPVKETEKRFTELTAQIQAIEHQGRMAQSALDESQRRQVARQRRWEQSLEELQTRVATELAHRSGSRSNLRVEGTDVKPAESRFRKLEQRQEFSETTLAALQMQVEEGLRAARHLEGGHEVQEVSERGLMALERKTSGQIQDLSSAVASLRVRVDGQLQRMSAMAERFENPNPSGQVVQLRNEVQQRSQDQQRCEAEMAVLRSKMQDFAESCDDSIADLREVVRKAMAELSTLQNLPAQLESMQAEFAECLMVPQAHLLPNYPFHLGEPVEEQLVVMHGGIEVSGRPFQSRPACHEVSLSDSDASIHYPPGLDLGAVPQPMQSMQQAQGMESDGESEELLERPEYEAASELHALAGHLLAADALAARVVQLEQDAGTQSSELQLAELETMSPWQVKLYRLSNDVGELQARLLSTRLQRELQVEAMLPEEMMPEGRMDLLGQERELRDLEEQVIELEQAFSPQRAVPAWEEVQPGPEDTDLADLAERLEPLEHAFRVVAERLNHLSLPGLVQSLVGQNGEPVSLDELLAKGDLGPELEEAFKELGAKAASSQVDQTLAERVSEHHQDLIDMKLQNDGISKEVVSLRGDVEELQHLLRKASSGDLTTELGTPSPLAKARGKLDLLCAEMAELQSRMRDTGPPHREREKYFQERSWNSHVPGDDEVMGLGPRSAGLGGSPQRR